MSNDNGLGRRRFLSTAVLGGAAVVGATAFGSLAPEQALASPALDLDPGAPDPNFAEGRISAITGSMLLVTGSDRTLHRIHVTGGTSVWKLRPTTFDEIRVGDGLYARGARLDDGTLAADALWVNIVNLTAHITAMDRDVLHLDHHGDRVVGHVVAGTTAAVYNNTPAVSDLSLLQVGRHVQVIGAWRPDTNEVDIATVFAAA
ncbi:cell wall protein [Allokutzneria oryzae]|uniref:Cell wall protein n=1 Tax=Allokutzneria oryzae TaxID=1378989 RepID=A0ABV5ZS91_9PSEU